MLNKVFIHYLLLFCQRCYATVARLLPEFDEKKC